MNRRRGINRNIVECKVVQDRAVLLLFFVLIETLWNVKSDHSAVLNCFYSINRNIVECKAGRRIYVLCFTCCINRNIVECKARRYKCFAKSRCVLIETLWNVKTLGALPVCFLIFRINRNIVECKDAARRDKETKLVPY